VAVVRAAVVDLVVVRVVRVAAELVVDPVVLADSVAAVSAGSAAAESAVSVPRLVVAVLTDQVEPVVQGRLQATSARPSDLHLPGVEPARVEPAPVVNLHLSESFENFVRVL
jgi:hypothetical protein